MGSWGVKASTQVSWCVSKTKGARPQGWGQPAEQPSPRSGWEERPQQEGDRKAPERKPGRVRKEEQGRDTHCRGPLGSRVPWPDARVTRQVLVVPTLTW